MNESTREKKELSLEAIWTTIYCANLFMLFPLFLRNGYLDIMEAKTIFFFVTTILYILGTGIIFFVKKYRQERIYFYQKTGLILLIFGV